MHSLQLTTSIPIPLIFSHYFPNQKQNQPQRKHTKRKSFTKNLEFQIPLRTKSLSITLNPCLISISHYHSPTTYFSAARFPCPSFLPASTMVPSLGICHSRSITLPTYISGSKTHLLISNIQVQTFSKSKSSSRSGKWTFSPRTRLFTSKPSLRCLFLF